MARGMTCVITPSTIKKILWYIFLIFLICLIGRFTARADTKYCSVSYSSQVSMWLDKLAYCESRNNPSVVNENDGGSPSYGYLQFKYKTFVMYSRKFGLFKDSEDSELMNLIMDKDAQLQVAQQIIEKDYAWQNWTNCSENYIGLPPVAPK